MTNEEIDKWVEDHLTAPKDSKEAPAVLQWGKLIAHKFYDIGWETGFDACENSLKKEL